MGDPHAKGLAKPGIAVSPPSTLLEMALPLDDQGDVVGVTEGW
jgi:hypothetical protein